MIILVIIIDGVTQNISFDFGNLKLLKKYYINQLAFWSVENKAAQARWRSNSYQKLTSVEKVRSVSKIKFRPKSFHLSVEQTLFSISTSLFVGKKKLQILPSPVVFHFLSTSVDILFIYEKKMEYVMAAARPPSLFCSAHLSHGSQAEHVNKHSLFCLFCISHSAISASHQLPL